MFGEISDGEKSEIGKVLEEYHPSGLDEAVKNACPFFDRCDPELSSVCLEFHELCKNCLLSETQVRLEETQIVGEKNLESGRADGSIYRASVNGEDILVQNGSDPELCLAYVEVKTGSTVKILQSAAYSFESKVPVILAEIPTGETHLIDEKTSTELLKMAKKQLERLNTLGERKRRVPGTYRCTECSRKSCPYQRNRAGWKSKLLVRKKTSQLAGKIEGVADGVTDIISGLIQKHGLQVKSGQEEVPVIEA